MKPLVIGMAGCGTVGSGLLRVLEENRQWIVERTGRAVQVKHVLVRDLSKPRDLPDGASLTDDPAVLTDDPEVDVLVELMGGIEKPRELIRRAIENGKHVVTANKALLAEDGFGLFRLAEEKGVGLYYEASVAGGIPIVQTLKESLAGNRITSLVGILNGTANHILSEMTSAGLDFETALAQAQELGYAEADPTLDIDGHDTAHKLVLLIRLAYGLEYPYAEMPVQGIRGIDRMDIEFAREFGFRIKLLGQVREVDGRLEAGVFPTLVRHTYLIARVGGAYNAIRIEGNAVGPVFLHGQGAGSLPTASSVLADLMAVARATPPHNTGFQRQVPPKASILPPDDAVSAYYVRVMVPDHPGVLRDLAGAMADHGISIAQAIQKGQDKRGVPLVFMTHEAGARAISDAIEQIRQAGLLTADPVCYRVL
ncbi:homoserine dehydrogenase [Nitratidesulfovibrio vulgaris]|uniref:Homoserine dehydrogenase n=1 Tax=Nitratidesulfovibrio vulgaris (strain ATCC 29579 / DSM 644 / CCUG 34227 / NCIMB 8303 / VKM B-1760 / Hildenborough) TaxID=882 RepID=Q72DN9_NITV2|nr:homoserine dehydrogenase [Nitratidesulfovibrio vulgaris]AAS95370.1 homoserine dehydrogenase [Nitratidesulfovibrio vulgaris str. Hildenborough]ADP85984.1 homoserine dehydrogenase [Nitratidesulfovibrio vulgaris RCH1]WCB47537.1 homoserine dehydrogenase [Nitratidesulfovibrio vulgaris]